MDFLTLAEATTHRSLRRFLQNSDTAAAAAAVDDDFSHLDTSHTSHHDYKSDSILDFSAESSAGNEYGGDLENAPMLSPAAEAELFMLATNFLLCKFKNMRICVRCWMLKGGNALYFRFWKNNDKHNDMHPVSASSLLFLLFVNFIFVLYFPLDDIHVNFQCSRSLSHSCLSNFFQCNHFLLLFIFLLHHEWGLFYFI